MFTTILLVRYIAIVGYSGKLEEKKQAISLRKQGYSYSEILKKVNVSKSTLSIWCRNIELSSYHIDKLKVKRLSAAQRGSLKAAKSKKKKKQKLFKEILKNSKSKIGNLSKRDRFIAGIALYLGDGYKTEYRVGFSNSNPKIIKLMSDWFVEFLGIKLNNIKARLWIHDNLDEEVAKDYWSLIIGIPVSNFIKSYVVKNKTESNKIRKNINKFGVLTLIINNVNLQRRMIGLMAGILD